MIKPKLERCPGPWTAVLMTSHKSRAYGATYYKVVDKNRNNVCCYIADKKTAELIADARNRRAHQPDNKALTVELLSEPIAARYDVADMLEDFKKEAEFSDHSVGINGITWAESALLAAIIDGLNVGRPPEKED